MTVKEAMTLFGYHQKSNLKQRGIASYRYLLKIGHFYFGKNRTFLLWLDTSAGIRRFRFLNNGIFG